MIHTKLFNFVNSKQGEDTKDFLDFILVVILMLYFGKRLLKNNI